LILKDFASSRIGRIFTNPANSLGFRREPSGTAPEMTPSAFLNPEKALFLRGALAPQKNNKMKKTGKNNQLKSQN
jgi:hypothetical protein